MPRQANRFGGGANTNRNGLHFEQTTSLNTALQNAGFIIANHFEVYDRNQLLGYSINQDEFSTIFLSENVKFFCNIFSKKIFNIVYLLFIIYNDIIRLQLQLFLSSFLKKCIEKRLSSGSHFLYAPLSFILLIFPFH